MNYAVCCVPVAPVRIEPDHRSEMISQQLFGENCIITTAEKDGWIKIKNKLDGYTGWCSAAQFNQIDEAVYNNNDGNIAADWVNEIEYNEQLMYVPFGSLLNGIDTENIWMPSKTNKDTDIIREVAFKFLNTSYLWGGKSVFGIDCSGFTQSVFKFLNISLLRDAHLQATQGQLVGFLQEARRGDLAFFDNEEGNIIHVGILLNNSQIIHAAGKVRIDKIDNEGIINTETGRRTQKLRIIKRVL